MYRNIVDINEIVEIMNLLGRTEGTEININNIGIVDKVYSIKKEEHSYHNTNDNNIKIEIMCSDGRMLTIYGYSHYEDPLAQFDCEYHTFKLEYRLPNNSVIRFQAGLNLFFEENHCSSMADAFAYIKPKNLTEDKYAGKLEGEQFEVLTPYFVVIHENGSEDRRKLQDSYLSDRRGVWGNMYVGEDIDEIRDAFNKYKFTYEELTHLAQLLKMKIENTDQYRANQEANNILGEASLEVLNAMQKRIGKFIQRKQNRQ